MAAKYQIRIDQGATRRLDVYRRQPLLDLVSGDPILDASGAVQPGPPVDLTGYSARMHIRKALKDVVALLELSSEVGEGITISAPVVRLLSYVRAASTANVTLGGTAVAMDGVTLVAGDRVLAKDQTLPAENGIYIVNSGPWTRALDADEPADLTTGACVWVYQGTANQGLSFRQTEALSDLATDDQVWVAAPEVGRISIVITDAQTSALTSGVYDLEIESSTGDVARLLEGKVRVSAEVTRES